MLGDISENEYRVLCKSQNTEYQESIEHHSRNLFLYANVLQTGETPSDTCLF